jgi:hypothetical protein
VPAPDFYESEPTTSNGMEIPDTLDDVLDFEEHLATKTFSQLRDTLDSLYLLGAPELAGSSYHETYVEDRNPQRALITFAVLSDLGRVARVAVNDEYPMETGRSFVIRDFAATDKGLIICSRSSLFIVFGEPNKPQPVTGPILRKRADNIEVVTGEKYAIEALDPYSKPSLSDIMRYRSLAQELLLVIGNFGESTLESNFRLPGQT